VLDGLIAATVPPDGHARPIRFGYGATVGLIILPQKPVADFQESRLFAGHFVAKPFPSALSIVRQTAITPSGLDLAWPIFALLPTDTDHFQT
jgi:hypothetical protein